ncbi:MAG TPA: IMP cyclohydrolase [Candidatus Hydrogenedentes bacterium]|nr:IMP cyclohydrolase [Candidatus Hydrogenedentota bacterium]HOS03408.1 IMP cyclohydrolase [Candidatus Hydrogenedentota bacterium]
MTMIRRAIISCHDKTGVVELARLLREFNVEIISTAGTLNVLHDAGIEAVSIGDYTGVQEMMDGRVKSLHSKVHAGILGIRDNKLHAEQLKAFDYDWIDMVVIHPHPVEAVISQPGITLEEVVEQIDIGGTAMIRSAAKNFRYVTVVVNPERYSAIMHELRAHNGSVTFPTRYRLALEAFACTAEYDQAIAAYLRSIVPPEE